jgi:hypothetical protein
MVGAAAVLVFAAATTFVLQAENQLTVRRTAVGAFDVIAREAASSMASLRAGQAAYVGAGQGLGFWTTEVDRLIASGTSRVEELRSMASEADTRTSLDAAAAALREVRAFDVRARQYLQAEQVLMASDVIFTDAGPAAATASRLVEAARQSEHLRWAAQDAGTRRQQFLAGAGAMGLALFVIGLLVFQRVTHRFGEDRTLESRHPGRAPHDILAAQADGEVPAQDASDASPEVPRELVPVLKATVEVCTELNMVREFDDLTRLLGKAAQIMDASGIVVWVGDRTGRSLRPVLAHGYSSQAVARMPHVPRAADNAAAAAYRTGLLQIVLTRPGVSSGALAAPMLSPNGCIGALTAELRNGSETSDGVQAIAAIVASQLAGVLADSVLQADDERHESRIASA